MLLSKHTLDQYPYNDPDRRFFCMHNGPTGMQGEYFINGHLFHLSLVLRYRWISEHEKMVVTVRSLYGTFDRDEQIDRVSDFDFHKFDMAAIQHRVDQPSNVLLPKGPTMMDLRMEEAARVAKVKLAALREMASEEIKQVHQSKFLPVLIWSIFLILGYFYLILIGWL